MSPLFVLGWVLFLFGFLFNRLGVLLVGLILAFLASVWDLALVMQRG